MIQHVNVELSKHQLDACLAFYELLGFDRVEPPGGLEEKAVWLQSGPTQLHLQWWDDPQPTRRGHFALVLGERYAAILDELRAAGRKPERRAEHWGSPRCFVRDPAGNTVELMEFAPSSP